jgi:hypothetical protein
MSISLGHMIQALMLCGALVGMYAATREDRARQDARIATVENRTSEQGSRIGVLEETSRALALTQVKISTLLEERTKRQN